MKVIDIEINKIKPYEKNPRFNARAIPIVKESILKFGFKVPLVIDKNNVIVCGHTRFFASKEIGLEKVPCIIADDLTDEQVNAFRLVDNRTSEFAEWNYEKLAEELSELNEFDLDAFGFDELIAGLKFDNNAFETLQQRDADVFEKFSISIVNDTREQRETIQELLGTTSSKIRFEEFVEKWQNRQ